LAAYGFEHPQDPFPELADEGPLFEVEGIAHPLLPAARAVRNDLSLGPELRMLIVSGSNTSGKSTLLRSVGVNTVLALAGAPVRARRLRLSRLSVGASIRVQDSLQGGISRFQAEILRLRRIVELTGGPHPVLFLLDEILHGTNSHDRRIGAAAVLRSLVERGAIGLTTTHDLALTQVAGSPELKAANVHFEDHMEDGRMAFDYHLRPGVVQKSNALELMRAVGLDV
ncbi:MAG TPA: DNA mismatch repair protein MutS, partial [Armatimonadota bacterium]|nr:DNA mismatch repair protein MutS [Armatimonadota bacterium]